MMCNARGCVVLRLAVGVAAIAMAMEVGGDMTLVLLLCCTILYNTYCTTKNLRAAGGDHRPTFKR